MAKKQTPKIAVKDVKERIKRADSYVSDAVSKGQKYGHNAQFGKTPKERATLDSVSKAKFADANSARKVSDHYGSILSAGMAKKAKESAIVQKKVSSSLFKSPRPAKPTVLKKKK